MTWEVFQDACGVVQDACGLEENMCFRGDVLKGMKFNKKVCLHFYKGSEQVTEK